MESSAIFNSSQEVDQQATQPTIGTFVPPASTLSSPSGKRMDPRVDFVLAVEFEGGKRLAAKDWSAGGFCLRDNGLVSKKGAIHRVRMHFALSGYEVVVDANAKVVWTADKHAKGFQLVEPLPTHPRVLNQLIQAGLDGEREVIGRSAVEFGGSHGVQLPGSRSKVMHKVVRAGKFALFASTVVGAAAFLLSRLLTVTTDYGAVSSTLQQVNAPAAGILRSDLLAVGARLKAGQLIGVMQPVATPQAQLAIEAQIAVLEVTLDQQSAALAQAKDGFATFLQTARKNLEEATASRALLEQQVAAHEKISQRILVLQEKGYYPEARVDQDQQTLLGLQRSLSTSRDTEATMRQKLVNAEAGRFTSDGHSTQKSPADLQQQMGITAATITRLRSMMAALDQPLPIVSPCDCTVTSLAATPGTYVSAGARLAEFAHHGDGTVVDALVLNPRLNLVRQGQAVTVYLANTPAGVPGRVTAINFNPANTGRTGLPLSLRTLDDYGLMTVTLDTTTTGLPTGLPATILAPIRWQALLAHIPLVVRAQSLIDDAARGAERLWAAAVVQRERFSAR